MPEITIRMDEQDFERLTTNSTYWASSMDAWLAQVEEGRFEHSTKKYDEKPSLDWKMAYFLTDSWTDVILARSFLESVNEGYEIVFDLAQDPCFVILTNFTSPVWRREPLGTNNNG